MDAWTGASVARLACVVAAILLAGCSGSPDAPPPPNPSPSSAGPPASRPPSAPPTMSVGAVIDIGGAEAYGLAVGEDAVWAISYQAGSLSRIDPSTGEVTRSIELGAGAASVLSDATGLWVAGYGAAPGEAGLFRLDPATGDVVARIESGELCCDLAAGGGSVWALDPGGSVLRIDPRRNRVADRIPVSIDSSVHTNVVYAGNALWVSSDNTPVYRLDPQTEASETIETGGGVPFLADGGLVWGAAPTQLWALDEDTGEVVTQIPLPNSMEVISLGIGYGSIWAGIRHPGHVGAVLRIDPDSGQVLGELGDVEIPARIAIGFDSVWITDSGGSSVFRIAPAE